jgi:hypothetical protein
MVAVVYSVSLDRPGGPAATHGPGWHSQQWGASGGAARERVGSLGHPPNLASTCGSPAYFGSFTFSYLSKATLTMRSPTFSTLRM